MRSQRSCRHIFRTAVVVLAAAVGVGIAAPIANAGSGPESAPPAPPASSDVSNAEWLNPMCDVPSKRSLKVTKKIYKIAAKKKGVDRKIMLSAFEAGWVESHMNNLNCGDRDSLGVFQQRPSQGWCDAPKDCLNVKHATKAYLKQAIANDKEHPGYTAGELAQSVQRSAYPDRYDKAKKKAKKLIQEAKKKS